MAAVSGLAVSLGSASVCVSSAVVFSVAAASVAMAEFVGPGYNYENQTYEAGRSYTGNVSITTDGNTNINAQPGANIKLTLTGSGTLTGGVAAESLWVTGSGFALAVKDSSILKQDVKRIYVNGGALQLQVAQAGARELQATFDLGASSFNAGGRPALSNSAITIGVDGGQAVQVSTTGGLNVQENSRIGFFNSGSGLYIKGAISGSGRLNLTSVSNGPGALHLMGGSNGYTGVIAFENNATDLYLGKDIELGGLVGSAAAFVRKEGEDNVELTLNVAAGANLDFAGGRIQQGIDVVKKGAGTQLLTNYAGDSIDVREGTLALKGSVTLSEAMKVSSGATLNLGNGAPLSINVGKLEGKIDIDDENAANGIVNISYSVQLIDAAPGANVVGWDVQNIVLQGASSLNLSNDGSYSAVMNMNDLKVRRDVGTLEWWNGGDFQGGTVIWNDGDNFAVMLPWADDAKTKRGSVTFILGEDIPDRMLSTPLSGDDLTSRNRTVGAIYVSDSSELVLQSSYVRYVDGGETPRWQHAGTVKWGTMVLDGTLVLRDKNILEDWETSNSVIYNENSVLVVDWRYRKPERGDDDLANYNQAGNSPFVGDYRNLPKGYGGNLVIRTGAFILDGGSYTNVTVETGANAAVLNNYSGNVTVSGTGITGATGSDEAHLAALKFANRAQLVGDLTIRDSATLLVWGGESATVDGNLLGELSGHLTLLRGTGAGTEAASQAVLNVRGTAKGIKEFTANRYTTINIESDFDASYIDEATAQSRHFDHLDGSGTLRFQAGFTGFDHVSVAGGNTLEVTAGGSLDSELTQFVKDGAGELRIGCDLIVDGKITVETGTLRFGDGAGNASALVTDGIYVSDGASFVVAHHGAVTDVDIVLNNSTLASGSGMTTSTDELLTPFHFASLELRGGTNFINWSHSALGEGFSFGIFSGDGDLYVDNMRSAGTAQQTFQLDEIRNYSGTIFAGIQDAANLRNNKRVIVSAIHQDYGNSGYIAMSNADGFTEGYVTATRFIKTGEGYFNINRVKFVDEVWMNYEGTLELGEVSYADRTVLHYQTGDDTRVIRTTGLEKDSSVATLYVDLLDLSAEKLRSGVNLGFASARDTAAIKSKLRFVGLDSLLNSGHLFLETRQGYIYVIADLNVAELNWDTNWGISDILYAPSTESMRDKTFHRTLGDESSTSYSDAMLQLGAETKWSLVTDSQSLVVTKITGGGGEYATVLGGKYYGADDKLGTQRLYTYIMMDAQDSHYHLLVGGASNEVDNATDSYGHAGNSHIQLEAGNVDYIVGGNHVSGGSFLFMGDSSISVYEGATLNGGIVGGSTYVTSNGSTGFIGDSNIFIYTPLSSPKKTPTISAGDKYLDEQAAFAAIIGGSAMAAYVEGTGFGFEGDSHITVDLTNYSGAATLFDKDIVGGNGYYTTHAIFGEEWKGSFTGDSSIEILTKNNSTGVRFTGVVAGASGLVILDEEPLANTPTNIFTGNTKVKISGGKFTNVVAGGFYTSLPDGVAADNTLDGNTLVSVNGGSLWRVAGGNYSVGGSADTMTVHDGFSSIEVMGGSFDASNVNGASLIVGADIVEGDAGEHVHSGESRITMAGGSVNGGAVIGGHYIHSTNGSYTTSRIDNGSVVTVSQASVTGVLVGGTFLQDDKSGGTTSISGGSHLTIGARAQVKSGGELAFGGVAAVAGNVLFGGGSSHTAEIEDGSMLSVTGGTITGHLVGGSAVLGGMNTLESDSTGVSLSGGTVTGNVYGGHYVSWDNSAKNTAQPSSFVSGESVVTVSDEARVVGNIFGGVHGAGSDGKAGSATPRPQQQGNVTVRLEGGSLKGDVYAAGEVGAGFSVTTNGDTRVELSSNFSFESDKTTVSGDYRKLSGYTGSALVSGRRILAFTDSKAYDAKKKWSGVTFRDFDAIDVAEGGDIHLAQSQFTAPASGGFAKLGAGKLTLDSSVKGEVAVLGGTLVFTKQQDISGGLRFDLTGRSNNDASSAFLQSSAGYTFGAGSGCDVFLDGDLSSVGWGTYFLASGIDWNKFSLNDFHKMFEDAGRRQFTLAKEGDCLVLQVIEKSDEPWLWRGNTHHAKVEAFQWDNNYAGNWNAHMMDPNTKETPNGKDLLFTSSAAGVVQVGEKVTPSSITVESGDYVFVQRSSDSGWGYPQDGITTDAIYVGGAEEAAKLELRLTNYNINSVVLYNNGELIVSRVGGITASESRDHMDENTTIYFDGGIFSYAEEFARDVSWQVHDSSTGRVRVGVYTSENEEHAVNNGVFWNSDYLLDNSHGETWSTNPGLNLAFTQGIEKFGDGLLHIDWQDQGITNYSAPIIVQGGVLEFLYTASWSGQGSVQYSINLLLAPTKTFSGSVYVAEGAEYRIFMQREGLTRFDESATFNGRGTVVIGRQLGDEEARNALGLWLHYPTASPRLTPVGVQAPYRMRASNMDFEGTIVFEGKATPGSGGDHGQRSANYIVVETTYADTENPSTTLAGNGGYFDYASFDSNTRTLNALGGGSTTLVLAGRHLSVHGLKATLQMVTYPVETGISDAGMWFIDENPAVSGDKYIRAGVVEVREGTLNYIGATWMEYTSESYHSVECYRPQDDHIIFTGKFVGSGVLATPFSNPSVGGYGQTLMGALNEFTGTIVAGDENSRQPGLGEGTTSTSSWTFQGSSASADVTQASIIQANLAGDGTMIFLYTRDTVLAGQIGNQTDGFGNNTRIINRGEGKLTIGSKYNTSIGVLHCYNGGIWLGDEDHYAYWNGTELSGDSTFTFVNGYILTPFTQLEGAHVTQRVETSDRGPTKVNAGGTLTTDLADIIINAGGYLEGITGDIVASRDQTYVKLVFNKDTVGTTSEGQHMIALNSKSKLIVQDVDYFLLDFTVDGLVDLLAGNTKELKESYLHILDRGSIVLQRDMWDDLLADGGNGARLLALLGFYVERVERGDIVLLGSAARVYRVLGDGSKTDDHRVDRYNVLTGYSAVLVQKGETLYIDLAGEPNPGTPDAYSGGCRVPNLVGEQGSALVATNSNPYRGVVNIIFDNGDEEGGPISTEFLGTITGGADVNFIKTGAGTLTVGYSDRYDSSGGFTGDSLTIRQGAVVLQGKSNGFDTLTFAYGENPVPGEIRGLTLLTGETTIGSIVEAGLFGSAGPITLGNNATLKLTGENVWSDIIVQREDKQSTGTLIVTDSLTMKGHTAQLDGVHLQISGANALVQLNGEEGNTIASLAGSGVLSGAETGTYLTVTNERDATFTGTLRTTGASNTLHIKNGDGMMTMRNVKSVGTPHWSLINEGKLTLDVSGKMAASPTLDNNMHFDQVELRKDSQTTYNINTDKLNGNALSEMLHANSFTAEAGAWLTIFSTGSNIFDGNELTIMEAGTARLDNASSTSLGGLPFYLSKASGIRWEDGKIKISLTEDRSNKFLHTNQHTNAQGGANLLHDMIASDASKFRNLSGDDREALVAIFNGIDALRLDAERTGNYAAQDRALAGVAGASVATLGPALVQDLQRQLNAIRNRTTTMGNNPNYVASEGPVYHAWINAEGNYHKMDADGLAPGFKISSWGGTVGMDVDVSERTSVGVALTAMYGTLDSDGPDRGEGKMDTYYLSLFARTVRGNWSHSLVGSIGLANVSFDRTVNYGAGSYKTDGSTNGYALGLMYEVGYSIPMNEDATFILQPVANIALRHTTLSGYEENGPAGLQVSDMTQSIISIGAGVRMQAVVGENSFNSSSIFEARVLAKVDSGDTNGQAETSLKNGAPTKVAMKAAEVGGVGAEIGAGLTVPLEGQQGGAVFFDGSVEIRSGYTNMNATVGYRLDF